MKVTIGPEASGERLDRALAALLAPLSPGLSRTRVKALISAGSVASEGATITDPSRRVKPGQIFAIIIPDAAPVALAAQAIPLAVVYEDADVVVVDKPAGMVVHPAPGNPDKTLVNALIAHCGESFAGIGGVKRPGIVHRLDKDTSGLMVVAKTQAAHQSLTRQFADRSVERVYAALVWGIPRPRQGEIEGNIGRSPQNRTKMAVVRHGGRTALTRYKVVRELAGGTISQIECRLATGRTHQIRVHLASIGHPLLADPTYGRARGQRRALPPAAQGAIERFGRQALDAFVLGFRHPGDDRPMRFEKKLSSDLGQLVTELEHV
jgi:23S rRNA pseudouridine1911/1915/1917 synthase